jgi:hypothetical protein
VTGAAAGAGAGALQGSSKTPGATTTPADTTHNPTVKPGTTAADIAAANPQSNVFKNNVNTAATDPGELPQQAASYVGSVF